MNIKPEIRRENNVSTLYVDGKPFIALGGELHNSSSSSTEYMREKVWPALRPMNVNSIVATVSWEQIEPEEGVFDFQIVDELISDARKEGIKLTLIWFALWKNGESSYVPAWVKRDSEKYFKCVQSGATKIGSRFGDRGHHTISPLCTAAVEADARAYAALMKHIRETDHDYTVIMMQIENEMGLMGSARDFSDYATKLFEQDIPAAVAERFGVSGSWKAAFADDAEEYFMAWYYALAIEHIAKAGTAEHDIPMYVNAWLQQDPDRAGVYPSGGPIAKMMDIWKLAAPTICMYAPDIYLPNFEDVVAEYSKDGNPVFIPETRTNVVSAATVFLAVGKYNVLGFNPFGIEDIYGDKDGKIALEELAALNIDISAFSNEGAETYIPASYKLILSMTDIIAKYRGTGKMTGFCKYGAPDGCMLSFTDYDIRITYGRTASGKPPAGGLVIETGNDSFIFAGTNFKAELYPKKGEQKRVEFIRIEEGEYVDGAWKRGRILNGDEQRIDLPYMPAIRQVEVYKY